MVHELILLLKELEEACSLCNRCGMCQSVCPVFLVTGHEADVARGKLALLDGLMEEILLSPENVLKRLNRCLLCGSCESSCSRKVNILEIFFKARLIINGYLGLSSVKKIILRTIIARPLLFDKTVRIAAKWQKIFIRPVGGLQKTSVVRRFFPLLRGRHIPQVASKSFHTLSSEKISLQRRPSSGLGVKAVFFAGCIIDKVLPEVGLSCVEVLEHFDVNVVLQEQEGCCGIPALASGDLDSFYKLIEYNVKQLSGLEYDYLITACASCTFTMKKLWPLIYEKNRLDMYGQIKELSSKVMDISEFLVKETHAGKCRAEIGSPKANSIDVTWHDPCHLKKTSGVFKAPRILLNSLPEYSIKEMEGADLCCGGGGSFSLEHYNLSQKIGETKSRNIRATGAGIVATGCPGCMIQLRDMLAKSDVSVEVKHVMEIVAESLSGKGSKI